mgnify:CR=1 FL=1
MMKTVQFAGNIYHAPDWANWVARDGQYVVAFEREPEVWNIDSGNPRARINRLVHGPSRDQVIGHVFKIQIPEKVVD